MTSTPTPRDPKAIRDAATDLSVSGGAQRSRDNGQSKSPYIFNFTKGLSHGLNGLLQNPTDFDDFVSGSETHDPYTFASVAPFRGTFYTDRANGLDDEASPDASIYREWESPTAGFAYVLQGSDPQAIPMEPAPLAGSAEFAAELAEVYQMALTRDLCVAGFMPTVLVSALTNADGTPLPEDMRDAIMADHVKVQDAVAQLSDMRWFKGEALPNDIGDPVERHRRRFGQKPVDGTLFRGKGEQSEATPFLSQFMVMGSGGAARSDEGRASGRIAFGAQSVDQRVNIALPGKDYMTTWTEYLDVQNGAQTRRKNAPSEVIQGKTRLMATLRDLATYVHDDALYQAYLNAALILLDEGFAADPGIPYHNGSAQTGSLKFNREPFALFGGPHLLTLVTEVSSRALKAVRYQKFTIHRRLRPEAAGALMHTVMSDYQPHRDLASDPEVGDRVAAYAMGDESHEDFARRHLGATLAPYVDGPGSNTDPGEPALVGILSGVAAYNAAQNEGKETETSFPKWLLPMAFAEGSPMHPAYGAGHATVAGACVTLLKAFFAMEDLSGNPVMLVEKGCRALVPSCPPSEVERADEVTLLGLCMEHGLTLESELNKLIWNISNGRNIGGVHYYTDYIESALLGEAITIGILREQMLCYHPNETVTMTVPLIVPRRLPAALLSGGSDISPDDVVKTVLIRSDGSLTALA